MERIDPLEPIAIVGLGGVFPKALDPAAYWKNVLAGRDCVIEVPRERWDWRLYWDADPKASDKTYSKIGGFIEGFAFDPLPFRIPPPVAAQMDGAQQLAVVAVKQAFADAGYSKGGFDPERTAVVLGNSMGGAKKDASDTRVYAARTLAALAGVLDRHAVAAGTRSALLRELEDEVKAGLLPITEDSMPGELSNVIAGRVANTFDLRGPNFTVDAACASSLAAVDMAMKGLRLREYDLAVCGGVDQMMSPPAYVKFSKIGALSPDGSRPFDARANGFVMGEGAGIFLLKRLSDALKDGDRVTCVLRAIGASSDGRGKGITAPNPKGQRLAIARCFSALDYGPEAVGLVEAHGTSTPVGDATEVQVLGEAFGPAVLRGSVALGSVKSQIGHLKAAAGAASIVKTAFALRDKVLPPSIHFEVPNPKIDFPNSPFRVISAPEAWHAKGPRRANVSAFGFGGTNFHLAMEEAPAGPRLVDPRLIAETPAPLPAERLAKLQGEAFLIGAETPEALRERLRNLPKNLTEPSPMLDLAGERRLGAYSAAFEAATPAKLSEKAALVEAALKDPAVFDHPPAQFRPKGIYLRKGKKARPKIAFLFPGQGSQYVDMLRDLKEKYRIVAETFDEADRLMLPALGVKLSEVVFSPAGADSAAVKMLEEKLKSTEYTQPAVLTAGVALLRLLKAYGVEPDVVCGHSLGEYGALVAAGVMRFEDALMAVSARAKEMASVRVPDTGKMGSVGLPADKVEAVLAGVPGYVAVANKNCPSQTVIAGETRSVEEALKRFQAQGVQAQEIAVSHAFHSKIVAPAREAYSSVLERIAIRAPGTPVLSNVTADYHPQDPAALRRLLVEQIAAPVEFISQVERIHADGVRLFVEVGPKRVLTAFVTSILEGKAGWAALSSNHPKRGGIVEFNDLLARLVAEGVDVDFSVQTPDFYTEGFKSWAFAKRPAAPAPTPSRTETLGFNLNPIVVSGIGVGAPGSWDRVFRDSAVEDILRGQNLIEKLSEDEQQEQVEKNVVRLIKSETGDHRFEKLSQADQVIKLAARAGEFDPVAEFGLSESLAQALDRSSALAIAAGLLALKDAGIPLVRTYRLATTGARIPTGWALPDPLRDETGVIFASAWPGFNSIVDEVSRHLADKYAGKPLRDLEALYEGLLRRVKDAPGREALELWYAEHLRGLKEARGSEGVYQFSRDFLLKVLTMGHSQMSQFIGARGPSLHINAACASTTTAVGMAEDWIRLGRAKRVLIVGADDITNDTLQGWFLAGFLAAGAATTEAAVSRAALPFDRRRHGMIVGMGAVGIVVEDGEQVRARGTRALAEVLATEYANSAFHATRLDTRHVAEVMDRVVAKAEKRHGLDRRTMAAKTLFMSHETYTPARGGSASAEVEALKHTFGPDAQRVVVCNTKGFTGHTMGASLEDPVAIMAMVTGRVPPIANYKEPDPELDGIRLSDGGSHDIEYALRLGAGFGSQIAVSLMRRLARKGEPFIADLGRYRGWLSRVSGIAQPELEVVASTLRVKDTGAPNPTGPQPPAPPAYRPSGIPATAATAPNPHGRSSVMEAPAPALAASASADEASVKAALLDIVSQKTGYPLEMLELDLDMEADLGIDTVKQAELIGIVRERYAIELVEGLSVKNYPTLRHVIRFVIDRGGTKSIAMPEATTVVSRPSPRLEGEPSPARDGGTEVPRGPGERTGPAAAPTGHADIQERILALVTGKTGYPREMLELDLDLEADLGIDTVKQAEIFGILRQTFDLARQENLSLKDYPTLRHMIGFVTKNLGGGPSPETPASAAAIAPAPRPASAASPVKPKRWVVRAVERPAPAGKKAIPSPALIVADLELATALRKELQAAGVATVTLGPDVDLSDPEALKAAAAKMRAGGPIRTLLHGLGACGPLSGDLGAESRRRVRSLFLLAQALGPDLRLLASLTTMDGAHGYSGGVPEPMAGAVTGLTKALCRELPECATKAVDLPLGGDAAELARLAVAELQVGDSALEVGYRDGKRLGIEVVPADPPQALVDLTGKSILITGGGQGLGAELAIMLAERFRPKLAVIGRTRLAPETESWAALDADGMKSLKTRIWEELKAREGKKATPVVLEREYSKVTKSVELYRNLAAMRKAGAIVEYLPCDLLDIEALKAAVKRAEASAGPLDAVIHAAGLEESKLLAVKTPLSFQTVFDAKATSARALADCVSPKPGQRWVFFSSVVARFGNAGQTDYAAANDYLVKLAVHLRSKGREACAADLTAFSGTGMALRGGVEAFLKSQGVEFLEPRSGMAALLQELLGGAEPEVLIAGSLGRMDADGLLRRRPEAGSVAPARTPPSEQSAAGRRPEAGSVAPARPVLIAQRSGHPPMQGTPPSERSSRERAAAVVEKRFSLESDPYLKDHAIAGTPYVPGVMGIQLFMDAAGRATGGRPTMLTDIRFELPIKLLRLKPIAVRILAKPEGSDFKLAIESDFVSPQGIKLGAPRTHFTARFEPHRKVEVPRQAVPVKDGCDVPAEAIYKLYFHGPGFQVLRAITRIEPELVEAALAPLPPGAGPETVQGLPRCVEAMFQACGYRDLHYDKLTALPDAVAELTLIAPAIPEGPLYVRGEFKGRDASGKSMYDAWLMDAAGRLLIALKGYKMLPTR